MPLELHNISRGTLLYNLLPKRMPKLTRVVKNADRPDDNLHVVRGGEFMARFFASVTTKGKSSIAQHVLIHLIRGFSSTLNAPETCIEKERFGRTPLFVRQISCAKSFFD